MNNLKKTIKELREDQYDYNLKLGDRIGVDMRNFRKNPYTFLKARFYMEASAILVYFLLKTGIKPNSVTIAYGLAGILGGVLLAIPNNNTIILAIFIFFTKGILDWSDGHLARVRNQTSLTGEILDQYGALLNSLGLQIGLGFYVAQKADIMLFYYLIPLVPLFYAIDLGSFSYNSLFRDISKGNIKKARKKQGSFESDDIDMPPPYLAGNKLAKLYYLIMNILDDRARTVDFILLLIIIEMYTSYFITWLIFLALVVKGFVVWAGKFYVVSQKGWAEKMIKLKFNEINSAFKEIK